MWEQGIERVLIQVTVKVIEENRKLSGCVTFFNNNQEELCRFILECRGYEVTTGLLAKRSIKSVIFYKLLIKKDDIILMSIDNNSTMLNNCLRGNEHTKMAFFKKLILTPIIIAITEQDESSTNVRLEINERILLLEIISLRSKIEQ